MKKVNFDAWVQPIGMISIVASLIFVGMQMWQSQQIALAGQQQARAATNIAVLSSLIESGIEQQLVFWEENFNYELSKEEIAFRNQLQSIWFLYGNDYYQYRQGVMDESTWSAKLVGIQIKYGKCRGRVIYNRRAPMFAEEFWSIIDSFPDECPN